MQLVRVARRHSCSESVDCIRTAKVLPLRARPRASPRSLWTLAQPRGAGWPPSARSDGIEASGGMDPIRFVVDMSGVDVQKPARRFGRGCDDVLAVSFWMPATTATTPRSSFWKPYDRVRAARRASRSSRVYLCLCPRPRTWRFGALQAFGTRSQSEENSWARRPLVAACAPVLALHEVRENSVLELESVRCVVAENTGFQSKNDRPAGSILTVS